MSKEGGVHTHRPAILRACIKALQLCGGADGPSFYDAAIQIREQIDSSGGRCQDAP